MDNEANVKRWITLLIMAIWLKKVDAYRMHIIYGPLCCQTALKTKTSKKLKKIQMEFILAKYRSKLQLFDLGITAKWKVRNRKMLLE